MPAYSYTSGSPIGISALNPATGQFIEVIYTASGSTYSYSSIAWLPEIQIQDQINVFTRPSALGPETQMINGTDFNFGSGETIVFVNAPSGQVVLRRSTDLSKMVLSYVDGAKFTSRQLNSTMHQLLFIAQEKANFETNIFNYYPVSVVAQAWNSGTSYVVNDVVIHSGGIYVCIANSTNNNPASSPAFWTLQNPQSNGFYVTGYNAPVNIHLGTMADGQTMVWSAAQKRFQAGFAISSSTNLSDYVINNPLNNQILEYSSSLGKWRNRTIQWTPTLTGTDLVLSKHIYSSVLTSFADVGTVLPGYLSAFNSGSTQVMPNAATVYHMLKQTIPGGVDPQGYFQSINSSLAQALQNLKNPVKAKLEWDLAYGNQTQRAQSGVALYGPYSLFWDHPNELYNALGNSNVWFHSLQETSPNDIYKVSPWWSFRTTAAAPATTLDLKSKIHGYGVTNFYLSVPESITSGFHIPVVKDSPVSFTVLGDLNPTGDFINIGDHNNVAGNTPRDMNLMALRDLAFAAARTGTPTTPTTGQSLKEQDNNTRLCKGRLIQANYDGFLDVTYKRLEQSEAGASVLWKIPANIIYYNTAALALSNKSLVENYITDVSSLRNKVRFQGYSRMASNDSLGGGNLIATNRNSVAKPMGYYFKADAFWADWTDNWSADVGNNFLKRFNEADIDWAVWDITNTSIKHFDTTASVLFNWNTFGLGTGESPTNTPPGSSKFYPWSFRPNQVKQIVAGTTQSGTHLLNIDANTLFSSSSSFVPDPVDTYVFRLVLNPTVTAAYFKETTPNTKPIINSAILLEHGFRDGGSNNETTPIAASNLAKIYPGMNSAVGHANKANTKSRTRLDKSKVTCRVISEQLEEDGTTPTTLRYVAKIAITIPRLKSIGYSKVFRKFATTSTGTNYPAYSSGNDTEIDSGPWSFNMDMKLQKYVTGGGSGVLQSWLTWGNDNTSSQIHTGEELVEYGTILNQYSGTNSRLVAGRNECAVKYTRIGIPSDFWLRVSILNTDASVSLVDPSNLNFQGV